MPRTVDKEEKARSIGRAALKVFRQKGYHPTRMSDIAKAAGVGKGTVYEYFRNKLQILQFVLDEYFTAFKEMSCDRNRALEESTRITAQINNQ